VDVRDQYFSIIKEKDLPNVLGCILELSYSNKLKILKELLDRFNLQDLKIALNLYKQNYIDLNRTQILYLKNVIISLCKNVAIEREGKCL